MKNIHAVIRSPKYRTDSFADLLVFQLKESKNFELAHIISIIHFLKFPNKYKNSDYRAKNFIILIMDAKFRKNGQNIKAFLKDYLNP